MINFSLLFNRFQLETEVELRLASPMSEMEKKIRDALTKVSASYSIPGTIMELEKLMQPKRATWSAITMGEYTSEQRRPGPSIFFWKIQVDIIWEPTSVFRKYVFH